MTAITQAAANKKKNNNLFVVVGSIAVIVSILFSVAFFLVISDNNGRGGSHHNIRSSHKNKNKIKNSNNNNNNKDTTIGDDNNNNNNNNIQNTNMNAGNIVSAVSPLVKQSYKLLKKTKLSPDSFLLRYGLPTERDYLGIDPLIPTCIKVDSPNPALSVVNDGTTTKTVIDESTLSENKKKILHSVLSKSYSPVSHPSQQTHFELVVKSYPTTFSNGGGVGKYLCDMEVGQSMVAELKSERIMHGSSQIVHRGWKHIGLIAGGTGIAPLLQLARILLEGDNIHNDSHLEYESSSRPKIHLLFINHTTKDILGKNEIESLLHKYPDNFFLTYSFTRQEEEGQEGKGQEELLDEDNESNKSSNNIRLLYGRGDVDMVQKSLPKPSSLVSSSSDTDTNTDTDTMIFVCGRDGFVEHWAGPVARGPPPPGKMKGPKIQGPLLGILKDAGYDASQVFKY